MSATNKLFLMPEPSSATPSWAKPTHGLTDPLAGLPNRVLFHRLLEEALSDAQRCRVAVLCLQLNRFDRITATLGQHTGDRLLSKIAKRVQDCLRNRDFISQEKTSSIGSALLRDSGDRFTILLTDLDSEDGAASVATRLLSALEPSFSVAGQELVVEASMGIAIQKEDGPTAAESLLRHAEIALFHVKDVRESQHRVRAYEFYSDSMDTSVRRALLIEAQIHRSSDRERRRFRLDTIGFVFQDYPLLEALDAEENVLLPLRLGASDRVNRDTRSRARSLLERLDLLNRSQSKPNQLSQGERQRVAIARALINQPKLILADEPTTGLDPVRTTEAIDTLIDVQITMGVTVIAVSHDPSLRQRFDLALNTQQLVRQPGEAA